MEKRNNCQEGEKKKANDLARQFQSLAEISERRFGEDLLNLRAISMRYAKKSGFREPEEVESEIENYRLLINPKGFLTFLFEESAKSHSYREITLIKFKSRLGQSRDAVKVKIRDQLKTLESPEEQLKKNPWHETENIAKACWNQSSQLLKAAGDVGQATSQVIERLTFTALGTFQSLYDVVMAQHVGFRRETSKTTIQAKLKNQSQNERFKNRLNENQLINEDPELKSNFSNFSNFSEYSNLENLTAEDFNLITKQFEFQDSEDSKNKTAKLWNIQKLISINDKLEINKKETDNYLTKKNLKTDKHGRVRDEMAFIRVNHEVLHRKELLGYILRQFEPHFNKEQLIKDTTGEENEDIITEWFRRRILREEERNADPIEEMIKIEENLIKMLRVLRTQEKYQITEDEEKLLKQRFDFEKMDKEAPRKSKPYYDMVNKLSDKNKDNWLICEAIMKLHEDVAKKGKDAGIEYLKILLLEMKILKDGGMDPYTFQSMIKCRTLNFIEGNLDNTYLYYDKKDFINEEILTSNVFIKDEEYQNDENEKNKENIKEAKKEEETQNRTNRCEHCQKPRIRKLVDRDDVSIITIPDYKELDNIYLEQKKEDKERKKNEKLKELFTDMANEIKDYMNQNFKKAPHSDEPTRRKRDKENIKVAKTTAESIVINRKTYDK